MIRDDSGPAGCKHPKVGPVRALNGCFAARLGQTAHERAIDVNRPNGVDQRSAAVPDGIEENKAFLLCLIFYYLSVCPPVLLQPTACKDAARVSIFSPVLTSCCGVSGSYFGDAISLFGDSALNCLGEPCGMSSASADPRDVDEWRGPACTDANARRLAKWSWRAHASVSG
jgi:hypothetical protein